VIKTSYPREKVIEFVKPALFIFIRDLRFTRTSRKNLMVFLSLIETNWDDINWESLDKLSNLDERILVLKSIIKTKSIIATSEELQMPLKAVEEKYNSILEDIENQEYFTDLICHETVYALGLSQKFNVADSYCMA